MSPTLSTRGGNALLKGRRGLLGDQHDGDRALEDRDLPEKAHGSSVTPGPQGVRVPAGDSAENNVKDSVGLNAKDSVENNAEDLVGDHADSHDGDAALHGTDPIRVDVREDK